MVSPLLNFPRKDPQAKIPYGIDWSDWLAVNEVINEATVTVSGCDDLGQSVAADGKSVNIILGGGIAGDIATIHFHIVTDTLVEDERTVFLEIVEL